IPMSSKLGMIECLDNTCLLKDLIQESYNDNQLDIITNQAKTANNTIMYAQLFLSLTKAQLQEEFNHIQSVIPVDLLRRAYYKIANYHQAFYT
ncbi:unnamed protein product, partial [Rotaria sordida]